jgi:enoyl-CoA hydratase
MQSNFETLTVDSLDGQILLVTLNRPEVANALNLRMGHELTALFEQHAASPEAARVVVLTGRGEKAFCAGADLKETVDMSDAQWRSHHLIFERMVRAIMQCPLPIVAAVNGAAYGGGCELACLSDFVYAAQTARFALPEVKLGMIPGAGGTQTLARAVGARRANELIFSGMPFSAEEATSWGLVNKVFAQSELLDAAKEVALRISENGPYAVRQAKQSIQRGLQMSIWDGLAYENEAFNRLIPTQDRREGVLAFREKRKPRFTGH